MNQKQQQKEVEQLTKQIDQLKLQKQLALSEAQAARSRVNQTLESTQLETDRLLKERTLKLNSLDEDYKHIEASWVKKQTALVVQDETLADRISVKQKTLADIQTAIAEKQSTVIHLDELEQQVKHKQATLMRLKTDESRLNSDILTANNALSQLVQEATPLETRLSELQTELEDAQTQLTDTKAQQDAETTAFKNKIALLDKQIYDKRQEYTEFDVTMQQERTELANRRNQLDARDQNVRIREAKVEQNEAKIQANNNLLNL